MKNNYIPFLLYVLLGLFVNSQTICQTVYENYWVPNNNVFASVRSGNTIYVGGSFTQIGPSTGCATTIDMNTGSPNLSFDKVNGSVITSVPDGSGGWYIGGYFTRVGDVQRNMLAHIYADGSVDPDWAPTVTGGDPVVRAIAIFGSKVFVGGEFNGISGYDRYNLAAIDAESGEVLVDWICDTDYDVFTLAMSDYEVLYAGGLFTNIKNSDRNYLAAINPYNGDVLDWNPDPDAWVYKVVPYGNLIYVGGIFTHIGAPQLPRNRIAAIHVGDGQATGWNPDVTGNGAFVYSITVSKNTVYFGGGFSGVGGQSRTSVAEVDIGSGEPTDWAPTISGFFQTVLTISISDAILYMGGEFTTVDGEPRFCLASVETVSGELTHWDPHPHEAVLTFSLSGTSLYTGGRFFGIGGVERNHLAAFDATTGMLLDWNPDVEGDVQNPAGYSIGLVKKLDYQISEFDDPFDRDALYCDAGDLTDPNVFSIAVEGSTVLVGGQFTTVGGRTRNNIAAINATTGIVIEDWDPNANGTIHAISIPDSIVFVGGYYTSIGNLDRYNIAALDLETGNAIESWSANANSEVRAIVVSDSRVYAGGGFTSIGGENRNYIAALDVETGEIIDGWHPDANNIVYTLALDGSILYAGGKFSTIGNESRNCIAAIDAESGIVVTNWNPNVAGNNSSINAIAVYGSTVYIAGQFTMIGQDVRNAIAALYKETGLATEWYPKPGYPNSPDPLGEVHTISVSSSGTKVYAGGFFSEMKDKMQSHFAALTGDDVTVVTNSLFQGWQTLSVPVVVDDFAKTSVWPTANSFAYSFCGAGGYVIQNILENGVGYWISFPSAQDIFYAGEFLEQYETPVCAGWNIVGSISEEVPISTNVCLFPGPNYFTSSFFIYQNGYQLVTTIKPGMGHWIKVALDGGLLVNIDPIQCDSPESIEEESMDHFIVTDADGKKQDLYVANLELNPSLGEMDLSLPPPLPEVGFDARFAEGEYIKTVSPDSGEVELVIDVEAQSYPITLSWQLNPENGITYSFIGDSGLGKISDIKSEFGKASFNQIRNNKIHLFASAEKTNNSVNHPTVYSLMQNYPNPFNPTTMIKYSLPKASSVKVIIYDILGREVATLIDEQLQPGDYQVKWDASKISSGIYFYQLKTKDYIDTKKMILLK